MKNTTARYMDQREREILNEKINAYNKNPSKRKRDELEHKWGLDPDIIDGFDTGEERLKNN